MQHSPSREILREFVLSAYLFESGEILRILSGELFLKGVGIMPIRVAAMRRQHQMVSGK